MRYRSSEEGSKAGELHVNCPAEDDAEVSVVLKYVQDNCKLKTFVEKTLSLNLFTLWIERTQIVFIQIAKSLSVFKLSTKER